MPSLSQLFEDIDEKNAPKLHLLIANIIEEDIFSTNKFTPPVNTTTFFMKKNVALFSSIISFEEIRGRFEDLMFLKDTPYVYYIGMTMRRQLPMRRGTINEQILIFYE